MWAADTDALNVQQYFLRLFNLMAELYALRDHCSLYQLIEKELTIIRPRNGAWLSFWLDS